MKTVADFKRKMVVGAKVSSQLFRGDVLQLDIQNRTCTVSQSNSFAMSVPGKTESSWCDWPKAKEFTALSDNKAEINFGWGRLVYTFE